MNKYQEALDAIDRLVSIGGANLFWLIGKKYNEDKKMLQELIDIVKPKNLKENKMIFTNKDLLNILGLRLGNKIKVKDTIYQVIYDSKDDSYLLKEDIKIESFVSVRGLESMIGVEYEIIQKKPILTKSEKSLLQNIYKSHTFKEQFIRIDGVLYSIEELINDKN